MRATPLWLPPRAGLTRSMRLRARQYITLAPGSTITNVFALESAFDEIRLVFANDRTETGWHLDGALIAPAAWIGDGVRPLTAEGAPATWVSAVPADPGLDVPPAPSPGHLGFAASAWVGLAALPPPDRSGGLPLLFVRCHLALGGRVPAYGPGDFSHPAQWQSVDQGRLVRSAYFQGDAVRDPQASGWWAPDDYVVPIGIQYRVRRRGYSVMTVGDSLTEGLGTVAGANGFGFQACTALSSPEFPVSHVSSAWSGQSAAEFLGRGRAEFSLFAPEIVVIETSSPNGQPATAANYERMLAGALALADHVERAGAMAVLKTAVPFNLREPKDGFRRAINASVRALGDDKHFAILDADAAVSDHGTPGRTRGEFLAAGDVHLNDAGHAAIAGQLVNLLRPFCPLRGNAANPP